ncbi:hypothetical protein [Spirochaeta dissipatitropha]
MKIRMNEQQLDVTINETDTIEVVLDQLGSWVESAGEIIAEVQLDGKPISSPPDPETGKQKAQKSQQLEITTCSPLEYRLRGLTVMDDYLNLLEEGVLKGNLQQIQDIAMEYPYIQDQLNREISGDSKGRTDLHTIILALRAEEHEPGEEQRKSVAVIIQMARSILQDRSREIIHPDASAANAADRIMDLMPAILEVSVQLQSMDQREAMHTVFNLCELLSKLLRCLGYLPARSDIQHSIDLSGIESQQQDLNRLLQELEAALEDQDSVSIGDIIEYEIAPLLETVCTKVQEAHHG